LVYFSDVVFFFPTGLAISFSIEGPAASPSDASSPLSFASLLSTRTFFFGAALALPLVAAAVALGLAGALAALGAALGFAGAFLA
jgi:hypothetical protein